MDIFHIGYEEGLSSELCESIELDDYGNLWIGGNSSLSKFDGYKVKNFNSNNSPLKGERVRFLFKDQNNHIWIVLKIKAKLKDTSKFDPGFLHRIYVLDAETDKFKTVEQYTDSIIKSEKVARVYKRNNILYLYTTDNELYSATTKVERVLTSLKGERFIGPGKGDFYFCFSDDLLKIRSFQNEIIYENYKILALDFHQLGEKGNLFINRKLIEQDEFEISSEIGIYNTPFFKNHESDYYLNRDGSLLSFNRITLLDDGVIFQQNYYLKKDNYKSKFEIDGIEDYKTTESGASLFATSDGVYVVEKHEARFKSRFSSVNGVSSTRGIYITDNLSIWSSSGNLGIRSNSSDYDPSFLRKFQKLFGELNSIYKDPLDDKIFWVCGFIHGSINKIDFGNKTISFDPDFKSKNLYIVSTIIRSSKSGKLYVGSSLGLQEVSEISNRISVDKVNFESSPNNFAIHRFHQFDDQIWCATEKGVFIIDEKNNKLVPVLLPKKYADYEINFIHRDKIDNQIYWLATRGSGLLRFDTNTGDCISYTELDGLSNNLVHSIYEDNQERLWLATNKFLSCLDKPENKFFTFTTSDGISHPEFNIRGDYFDSITNTLHLAGMNGISFFNPDSIELNNQSLGLRILKAQKITNKGKVKEFPRQLIEKASFDLFKEDLALEISLATYKIKSHQDVSYSSRIPQLDSSWTTQSSNILKINRLPYGVYTLEIIGDQNKLDSRTDILELKLNLIRPFFEHPLVLIFFCFALAFALVQIFKYRNRIILKRNLFLEGEVEKRTAELRQSNESKNRLFALLAHDLRNPIASLSNIAKKINFLNQTGRQNEIDDIAQSVQDRVNALSKNIDDILLWAIRERSKGEEIKKDFNLKESIENVLLLYPEEIANKNLNVEILIDASTVINADEKAFMVLLRNFVINAIKYNKEQGSIHFYKKDNSVLIVDTGVGIEDSKKLKSIAENSNFASHGLGLALSQEIANASGLSFELRGNEKGGATVEIFL